MLSYGLQSPIPKCASFQLHASRLETFAVINKGGIAKLLTLVMLDLYCLNFMPVGYLSIDNRFAAFSKHD